jgi:hypothetical protein
MSNFVGQMFVKNIFLLLIEIKWDNTTFPPYLVVQKDTNFFNRQMVNLELVEIGKTWTPKTRKKLAKLESPELR